MEFMDEPYPVPRVPSRPAWAMVGALVRNTEDHKDKEIYRIVSFKHHKVKKHTCAYLHTVNGESAGWQDIGLLRPTTGDGRVGVYITLDTVIDAIDLVDDHLSPRFQRRVMLALTREFGDHSFYRPKVTACDRE